MQLVFTMLALYLGHVGLAPGIEFFQFRPECKLKMGSALTQKNMYTYWSPLL
jgi:hypothetical protein